MWRMPDGTPFIQTAFSVRQVAARWGVSDRRVYDPVAAKAQGQPVAPEIQNFVRPDYANALKRLVLLEGIELSTSPLAREPFTVRSSAEMAEILMFSKGNSVFNEPR